MTRTINCGLVQPRVGAGSYPLAGFWLSVNCLVPKFRSANVDVRVGAVLGKPFQPQLFDFPRSGNIREQIKMKCRLTRLIPYTLLISVAFSSSGVLLPPDSWGHKVGEPELERLPIWKQCCGDGDCVPQPVKIITKSDTGKKIVVNIEGVEAAVEKDKFTPVPSDRTWVCYQNPNGRITNENIRCILYPQKSGTT